MSTTLAAGQRRTAALDAVFSNDKLAIRTGSDGLQGV
jgi:hypothetical protein